MTKIINDSFKRLFKFGYISFLVMFAIGLVGELIYLYFSHNLTLYAEDGGAKFGFTDFVRFYVAGKITLSPFREQLYSWPVQKAIMEKITQCNISGEDFFIQYVPMIFLMMAPYTILPIRAAHLLFDVVNFSVGMAGYWLVVKHFGWTKNKIATLILIGAVASDPSWETWFLGQIAWLYFGIICFYLVLLLKNKQIAAGLALALCSIKPQYAIFLLIPALVYKRYYTLLFAGVWLTILLGICSLFFGIKTILAYPSAVSQCEASWPSIKATVMYCFRAIPAFFCTQQLAYQCAVILWLISIVIITGICVYRLKGRYNQANFSWMIAIMILSSLMFSPHSHAYDSVFLTLPALLTLNNMTPNHKEQNLTERIWCWLLYLMPIISWLSVCLIHSIIPGNVLFLLFELILLICAFKQFWRAFLPARLEGIDNSVF